MTIHRSTDKAHITRILICVRTNESLIKPCN